MVAYGATCMQGWRMSMEDASNVVLEYSGNKTMAFAGVYDGHGGDSIAKYAQLNLHSNISNHPRFEEKQYVQAIEEGYLITDKNLRTEPTIQHHKAGSTAVIAVLIANYLYIGNLGDSRAVLCSKGKAIPLTVDHKPSIELEKKRILKAGGIVEHGRVNGHLGLSRALGDFRFKTKSLSPKDQMITALPDVNTRKLEKDDEFIILACDGVWDCLSSQEVVTFVRKAMFKGMPLSVIAENLLDYVCPMDINAALGQGGDNMSIIIMVILNGQKNYEEWSRELRQREMGEDYDELDNSMSIEKVSSMSDLEFDSITKKEEKKEQGDHIVEDKR